MGLEDSCELLGESPEEGDRGLHELEQVAGARRHETEGEAVESKADADGRHSEAGEGLAVRNHKAGGEHRRAEEELGARVRSAGDRHDDGGRGHCAAEDGDENEDDGDGEKRAEDPLVCGGRERREDAYAAGDRVDKSGEQELSRASRREETVEDAAEA